MKYSSIDNPLDILLQDINKKEEIKIEVYFNKLDYRDSISVEFKIGLKNKPSNKLNVIKDIKQFLIYYEKISKFVFCFTWLLYTNLLKKTNLLVYFL